MGPGLKAGHALALLAAIAGGRLESQTPDPAWDVTKPRGTPKEIDFTTSEGTWMSTDITPDGRWIVFNLLGHVYRMPAAGGEAESLTQESGMAVNYHPRISPDGSTIAFITDRNGQSNIWLIDIDGKNPRAVTQELGGKFLEPTWSPDGRYLVARRLDAVNTFGASIMMFHRDGGQGTTLVKIENNLFPGGPKFSPDGRYLYYQTVLGPVNGYFSRNDVLQGDAQVQRLDLQSGKTDPVTSGHLFQQDHSSSGGGYGVEPSPDGRYLAFARRQPDGLISYKGKLFGPRTALWIRDLQSGAERLAMDPIETDFTEGLGPVDQVIPGYRWTADGKILISQGGKIRRLDVASGTVTTVPFTARVRRTASERVVASRRISDGPVEVKFPRWHGLSPDGRTLAFQAVGRIWVMDYPSGKPRRLTPESFEPYEYGPTWSPDGRSIVFTSWDDLERGHVYTVVAAGGAPNRVTTTAGEYQEPSWSADGRTILVARGSGATARGQALGRSPYWDQVTVPAAGGQEIVLGRLGSAAARGTVAADRVWFGEPSQGGLLLVSTRLDGSDRREYVRFSNASEAAVSPDARWVAFVAGGNAYVTPTPPTAFGGAVPAQSRAGGPLPVTKLSATGGLFVRWRDANTVTYGSGPRFVSWNLTTKRADTAQIRLTVPRDIPTGTIAVTNARILTMESRKEIPSGTVVIKAGRIACVGSCSTTGADRVVDVEGRTVIPGIVDMHAHHQGEYDMIQPRHDFSAAIYLAYGVTTTHNPAAPSMATFPQAELVEAGGVIGPRVFATAETFGSADNPGSNTFDQAEGAYEEAARRVSWGAVSLKEYLQPDRRRRQWVVEAGRRLGVMVTSEGSMDIDHKVSMALDGHTGFEHATAQTPLYSDIITLLGKLGSYYSATPMVGGPGPWNEEYFWQERDVWKDPKQQRWLPWRQLIPHTRRRILRPKTDYSFPFMGLAVADIVAAGGGTAIGSHGQQHGLASHWDIWMYAEGMGPAGALEAATILGARYLGMDKDLGSIEVGKLGDLVVLNADPLANIRNTADIRYVVKAGVLYDADSLDELWPRQRKYGDYYWYIPDVYRADTRPVDFFDRK